MSSAKSDRASGRAGKGAGRLPLEEMRANLFTRGHKGRGARGIRTKRFLSIARRVSWGFWWRRLLLWLVADACVLMAVALILMHGYARELPAATFDAWMRPAPGVGVALEGARGITELPRLMLTITRSGAELGRFPLGEDLVSAWPAALMLALVELGSLIDLYGDVRRVRKSLQPLNELALRAEEIGFAAGTGAPGDAKIESLERAIGRATPESPLISTGDGDLASIEVALNTLLRRMQEAKLQQMRFVSDASHELRTPIAVIQGYVNMLDRWGKDDPAVLEESIAALKAESQHMAELVEQLLFLARGDSGRNALVRERVQMARIVVEVWEESTMIDADHVYTLGFDEGRAQGDGRFELLADAGMLKQSMRIIVQNAAKYSPAGTEIRLDVRTAEDGGSVAYVVQDAGIGMSSGDAAHVFERFWRADAARASESAGGSGLGLSIAKWIVDAHGGSIELVSREGVGTRFIVSFPRA